MARASEQTRKRGLIEVKMEQRRYQQTVEQRRLKCIWSEEETIEELVKPKRAYLLVNPLRSDIQNQHHT